MMKNQTTLAIATCHEFPELTEDDRLLLPSLKARGLEPEPLIWNDDGAGSEAPTILLRSTWDYYLKPAAFSKWLDEIEDSERQLLNPVETVRWNFDKTYLTELEWAGVPCYPSLVFKRGEKPAGTLAEILNRGWRDLVIKPTISAGSYLTFRIDAGDTELPSRLNEIQKHSDVLIQPYSRAVEEDGEASLVFFQARKGTPRFSHAVIKRPKDGEFRVQADFGGSALAYKPSSEVMAVAEETLSAVPGPWVYARVDLLDWRDNPQLSEVELIEPCLFLSHASGAAEAFAEALVSYL